MNTASRLPSRLCLLAVALLAGCTAMPARGPAKPAAKPAAVAPAPVPAMVIRGDSEAELQRRRKSLAAGPQGLQADAVGYYMDVQQARIKQLGSSALGVARRGDSLLLSLPGALGFEVGSARLSAEAQALLTRLGKVLVEYRSTLVSVHGHTDDTGSAAGNQALSEQRAAAVARQLAAAGVASARLAAIGHGASRPLVANSDEASRERNRRVELRIDPLRR